MIYCLACTISSDSLFFAFFLVIMCDLHIASTFNLQEDSFISIYFVSFNYIFFILIIPIKTFLIKRNLVCCVSFNGRIRSKQGNLGTSFKAFFRTFVTDNAEYEPIMWRN